MRFRKRLFLGVLCLALATSMLLSSCASRTSTPTEEEPVVTPTPDTEESGVPVGQGDYDYDDRSEDEVLSGKFSRYNTVAKLQPEEGDAAYNRSLVPEAGDTRITNRDSTRRMYEWISSSRTLVIHGYGSIIGSADGIGIAYQTPGTIGGGVLGAHRKSWLDGFYPYIYDGKVNGPELTRTELKGKKTGGVYSVESTEVPEDVYDSHETINAADIRYIIIDDLTTMYKGNIGLSQDDVHDSYAMYEDEYVSGITEIAPYAFANLYNLEAIDFDASQIKKIGDYAFAGCEKLGASAIPKETALVNYEANGTSWMGKDESGGSSSRRYSSRKYYNHDYTASGCKLTCKGECVNASEPYYKEMAGRILLPHGLVNLGEHVFQNCPKIQEYVIHEDNPYFIASAGEARWRAAEKGNWDAFTDGVIYSSGKATDDGIRETGYMRLRAAVMSDYQATPEQYKKFWMGPFGEKEPMPLEWYVKSWNAKDYAKKIYEVTADPPEDHFNWTEVEAAINKAKAAIGHIGTGKDVVVGTRSGSGTEATPDNSWKTKWVDHLPEGARYRYDKRWWNDDFFNLPGEYGYGYDRSKYGVSIKDAEDAFAKYMEKGGSTNFNTLFVYPEGKGGGFFIYPGHDPADYDPASSTTEVAVIGPFAFSNAQKLTSIDMSACCELTTFGQGTFMNCQSLKTVIFPEAGCTTGGGTLNTSGRQPNYDLTRLSDDMFSQCRQLSNIYNLDRDQGPTGGLGSMEYGGDADHRKPGNARSTIQEFGQNCFHKCLSLTEGSFKSGSTVDGTSGYGLPDTLLIIGQSCFHTCKGLTGLKIHKNIEIIGDYAFSDCYNLSDLEFEDKTANDNSYLSGQARDRIPDNRNKTYENKQRQFYTSASETRGPSDVPGPSLALQFGNKTFEHCTALSYMQVGSTWLIQKTTFENAIYITLIDLISAKGNQYSINKYDFNNGNTGQDGRSPDRVSNCNAGATGEYFADCAYRKGLRNEGTRWYKND